MLKLYKLIPMVALLAVTGAGIQAQQMPGPEGMHKRFEQMDRKMEDAGKSHGTERQQHVHEHMRMMQAMHGMMGGGKPGMGMGMGSGGRMGSGPHGTGDRMAQGGEQRMQHMQNRMDMMQGMMEQMQKQHELMLKDGADKKN